MEKIIILTIVSGVVILLVVKTVRFFRRDASAGCSGCGSAKNGGCESSGCGDKN
jgi:hypothetical protein